MRVPSAVLVLTLLAVPSLARAHPPLLPAQEGCELYVGTVSGNDPGVRVNVRLCPDGDNLRGQLQWSSQRSGYNVRELSGTREAGDRLVLHDTRITESHPQPGWRFCTVDRYVLRPDGQGGLSGTYRSNQCNDSATVRLSRIDQPEAPGGTPGQGTPGAQGGGEGEGTPGAQGGGEGEGTPGPAGGGQPAEQPTPPPPPPPGGGPGPAPPPVPPPPAGLPGTSGCTGCAAVPTARPHPPAAALVALALVLGVRRRTQR